MLRLGIDIGGTKVNMGLLEEDGQILFRQKTLLPEDKSLSSILPWIANLVKELLKTHAVDPKQVGCCGIGVPGTVSRDGKRALKVPNLGWEQAPLAEQLEALLGIPCRLVQDSRAAAYGEYRLGSGKGRQTVVCVTLGTGIGTGIVQNGKIFDGAMGGAGELGHIPVVPNGRPCGCGKKGCLECYVAGKGLTITAQELFGSDSSAEDLFARAEVGNKEAQKALADAVELLGNAMVALVNLLSPDCLLFSGGMSQQKKWLVEPLTAYIQKHRYSAGEELVIGMSTLGEDAPMLGAALVPETNTASRCLLAPSVMCADLLHLERDLRLLEETGMDYLHCDMMDGHFVPNLTLSYDLLRQIRQTTTLPFDIHLMTEHPETVIPLLPLQKGDFVSVHWESTPHVQRALALVREKGASPALALNPSTPIECVRDLLEDLSMILVMTVNPGFSGQKLIPSMLQKITRLRALLKEAGYPDIRIEADGNCSFENIPRMRQAGANMVVLGTSSIFDTTLGIRQAAAKLREIG